MRCEALSGTDVVRLNWAHRDAAKRQIDQQELVPPSVNMVVQGLCDSLAGVLGGNKLTRRGDFHLGGFAAVFRSSRYDFLVSVNLNGMLFHSFPPRRFKMQASIHFHLDARLKAKP